MTGWPDGTGRLVLEQTDSTNSEAKRRAVDPTTRLPLWIMARRQVHGRGRQGRGWRSGEGNLTATWLGRPALTAVQGAQLSFAACLAVADLAIAVAPRAEVRVKWPNDVLVGGRKVAGVLLESAGQGGWLDWLAVGVGVNLAHAPAPDEIEPGRHAPTSLAAEGVAPPAPEQALERLATRFEHWRALHAREGFAPLRAAWLARAAGLGQRIEARLPGRTLTGTYEDVDAEGSLVLRHASGRARIAAAELVFPA